MVEVVLFLFEELTVWGGSPGPEMPEPDPHTLNVQVNMVCTDPGQSPHSRGYPGWPPEYEVDRVYLSNPSMQPVGLSETQFLTVFPDAAEIINNALEWAVTKDHD